MARPRRPKVPPTLTILPLLLALHRRGHRPDEIERTAHVEMDDLVEFAR
jgi:hypothetical protein